MTTAQGKQHSEGAETAPCTAQDAVEAMPDGEVCPVVCPDPRPAESERQRNQPRDLARAGRDKVRPRRGKDGVAAKAAAADPEGAALLKVVKATPRNGGRRKDGQKRKVRPKEERLRERLLDAALRKPKDWLDSLDDYHFLQLVKAVVPKPPTIGGTAKGKPDPFGTHGLQVRYADEPSVRQGALHGPYDADEQRTVYRVGFDGEQPDGVPGPANPTVTVVLEGDDPRPKPALSPIMGDTISSKAEREHHAPGTGELGEGDVAKLNELCQQQTPAGEAARKLVKKVCAKAAVRLKDRERKAREARRDLIEERRAMAIETERLNRLRMYDDPNCWNGNNQ